MNKVRRRQRGAGAVSSGESTEDSQFSTLWLAAVTALLVATPLIPSESRPELGTGVVLTMGWFVVLLGWSLAGVLARKRTLHWSLAAVALLVFVALVGISGWWMAGQGQPRSVINMCWQWVGYAVAFFIVRQVVRQPVEIRALVVVMIGLAACLSMHSFWQYAVAMPETRRLFEEDPEQALLTAGFNAPQGSAERALFVSRLYSTEPTATFTLANSLAGFLTPWLIVTAAILFRSIGKRSAPAALTSGLAALAMIGTSLVLTKSRTAWIAALLGFVLLAIAGRQARRESGLDARVVAGIVAVLLISVVIGVLAGGLDSLVITESQKSVLYRVQYWQATGQMIREHPWFGCGPGNFQQFYTSYKFPEASETVADPHNFVLEVWATMGTPALVAFAAVLVCCIWHMRRPLASESLPKPGTERPVWPIYGGALAGIAIARPAGLFVGFEPDPIILLVGVPVAGLVIALLHDWVRSGELPAYVLGAAVAALLINLLAAGGISYAGVATSIWLLLALAMNLRSAGAEGNAIPHWMNWVVVTVAGLLVLAMYTTAYRPVTAARTRIGDGQTFAREGLLAQAEGSWQAAAELDPQASRPWNAIADVRHRRWLTSGGEAERAAFQAAAEAMIDRNRRSSEARMQYGHWLLLGYRRLGDREFLEQAVELYREVIELYPNYNRGHAQLAWVLHLAAEPGLAAESAARALELDARNPHVEQKLHRFQLFDPGGSITGQVPGPGDVDTEQWMRQLRNGQAETVAPE